MMPEFRPIANGQIMEAVGRVHIQDWPDEAYQMYEKTAEPLPSMRLVHTDDGVERVMQGTFSTTLADAKESAKMIIASMSQGKSFDELVADSGGTIEIIG